MEKDTLPVPAACPQEWDDAAKYRLLKQLIINEAERGFAHYLYELLPDVERLFSPAVPEYNQPAVHGASSKEWIVAWVAGLCDPVFIFELDGDTEQRFLDLLIVVASTGERSFEELQSYIRSASTGSWNIRFSLCQLQRFCQQRKQGNFFFLLRCNEENLVYHAEDALFEPVNGDALQRRITASIDVFTAGCSKARLFLGLAASLQHSGSNELACFALHQAAELTLRGFAEAFSGMHIRQHSIKQLLLQCARQHPCFLSFFRTETEYELLAALEASYTGARYDRSFTITDQCLLAAKEKVNAILAAAEQVAGTYLETYVFKTPGRI
ncbi:HEPN domain-containing protein [Niabella beijingensis]|uniref:HEPN domain-containing protein n=1 Tax=Niabella beijingensis TaxID=2872700 RepID=UPI001CC18F43|nr:HEPN domain-containing protein [Niabella beijingensis]MBZ4188517.1 HEPN domain-containing protein [Niabella beijingensis]